jgi:hypothetical protein
MKIILFIAALLIGSNAIAQSNAKYTKDVSSEDNIIAALYNVIRQVKNLNKK